MDTWAEARLRLLFPDRHLKGCGTEKKDGRCLTQRHVLADVLPLVNLPQSQSAVRDWRRLRERVLDDAYRPELVDDLSELEPEALIGQNVDPEHFVGEGSESGCVVGADEVRRFE